MWLTGTNSENGRSGRQEISNILETVVSEGLLNLLLQKAEGLPDFWEIITFIYKSCW